MKQLIKICKESNYNFFVQYWDGEFSISIDDNNVTIEKEIASLGGYDSLDEAIKWVLKQIR